MTENKQGAVSDASYQSWWVPAYGVATIAADTAISKNVHAIAPETDVQVYFNTDSVNAFTITAGTLFAVHPGQDVKLKTETVCLLF